MGGTRVSIFVSGYLVDDIFRSANVLHLEVRGS